MARLPVVSTVLTAYRFVFSRPLELAKYALVPALIAVMGWTYADWRESRGVTGDGELYAGFAFAWFGYFWSRRFLLGADAVDLSNVRDGRADDGQTDHYVRFLFQMVLYVLLFFALVGIPTSELIVGLFEDPGDNPVQESVFTLITILLFAVGLYYPISALLLRFALTLPATAVTDAATCREASKASKGNSWRLANAVALSFLLYLPGFAVLFGASFLLRDLGPAGWVADNLVSALLAFPIIAIQMTCLGIAFQTLAPERYEAALLGDQGGTVGTPGESSA